MNSPSTAGSREEILARVRKALPQSAPLPEVKHRDSWQIYEDPLSQFSEVLEFVGGTAVRVDSLAEVHTHLSSLPQWADAAIRCSFVDGVGDCIGLTADGSDAVAYESVEFAVMNGELAVAENGAVWVTDEGVPHRVLYFIPQHMALVVPAAAIVNNMHEAYSRVTVGQNRYAGFISGPSKTADIEQSLVIGAHGARSLTVYLVGSSDSAEA